MNEEYKNLSIEKIKKCTNDLKIMSRNNQLYGEYTLEPPTPTTRVELYKSLQIEESFNEINEKYNEMQKEIQKISKDGRYKDQYKQENKQKKIKEFQQYREAKLNEIKDKMNVYRSDIQDKYSYKVEDKQLEAVETNSALLQLAFLDNMENNTELMKQFVEDNWNRKDIISLVEAKYKDNPAIATKIHSKREEDKKPFKLVDSAINDINTFINNRDYICNSSYIEEGITKFNQIDGGHHE